MHCFVPSPLLLMHSSSPHHHLHHHGNKKKRSRHLEDTPSCLSLASFSSSSSCAAMSVSSSVSSLSTCASTIPIATTASSTTANNLTKPIVVTNKPKKHVRFANDKDIVQVHLIPNKRKFKFPEWLWWQSGELPSQNWIVRTLLELDDNGSSPLKFLATSPHEQARRIVTATANLLTAHAQRGGGRASLRAQAAAAAEYQASMQAAAIWRGLESLIMDNRAVHDHAVSVLLAQQCHHEPIWQAARVHSRPAAQLAMERARFDAHQVGQKV